MPSRTIVLAPATRRELVRLVLAGERVERCGLLIGRRLDDGAEVVRVAPTPNSAADPGHRFTIAPESILEVHRSLAPGEAIVGVYHSHPDGSARPSRADHEGGWPGVSTLIVGVEHGRVTELRSWYLALGADRFTEELVEEATPGDVAVAPAAR